MEPDDLPWMSRALELARRAGLAGEVPVGAVLALGSELLAEGTNARESTFLPTAHAEIEALRSFSRARRTWRLPPGATLYVTAEPCLMCTGALLWARASRVVYGCADPRGAGLERQRPAIEAGVFDHRFENVTGGVLADEAAALLKGFFARRRAAPEPG